MRSLIFDPLFSQPLMAALWTLGAALVLAYVFWRPTRLSLPRRIMLLFMHALPLAFLIFMLYRPTWVRISGGNSARPVLAVLMDKSASMAAEDAGNGQTRFIAAAKAVAENGNTWRDDFDVRVFAFDKTLSPAPNVVEASGTPPQGTITDIAGAVEGMLRQHPSPSLALILSDGGHNASESDLPGAARSARAAGIPVFSYCIGSNVAAHDLGVTLSSTEEMAFVRQRVRVPVMVTQVGFDNSEVEVELRQNNKTVETRKVRFEGPMQSVLCEFFVSREATGVTQYEIVIPPRPGEALVSNNRRRFALRVIDERVRILLLEGKPFWDSKFLERVLRRDPNVQLTAITLFRNDRAVVEPPSAQEEAPLEKKALVPTLADSAAPDNSAWFGPHNALRPLEDRRFLSQFQVLMFGRDADAFLSEAAVENLREWVATSGGHLVCTRGRPALPDRLNKGVAAILPIAWKPDAEKKLRLKLTDRGRALGLFDPAKGADSAASGEDPDVVLNLLPSLVTATTVERERSLAVVLARMPDESGKDAMAVLSTQTYGSGKTVVLEGQGMWRWAFRPAEDKLNGEELFRAFWANMIRWLAGSNEFLPSQEITLRAGKPIYNAGEKPVLYVMQRETEKPAGKTDDKGAPAASASLTPAALPKIEIVREDALGFPDRAFTKLRVNATPMPRETNMFRAELEVLDEGQYRARLVDSPRKAETTFEVMPPFRERLDLRARPETLEQFSRMTDARRLKKEELASLGTLFTDFVRHHNPGREIKEPAWDSPLIWVGLMTWLALAWWTRRRWGAI